jgi:hypothetical protein
VLDNLALIAGCPDALPYFAVLQDGTTQVQHEKGAEFGLAWTPYTLAGETLALRGNRVLSEQWGLDPVKEPERLDAMRWVYRWATRGEEGVTPDGWTRLGYFHAREEVRKIPPGFFQTGKCGAAPKDACYVGRSGAQAVWVDAAGVEALTRLTLVIMDIATIDLEELAKKDTKTVEETYEYRNGKWVMSTWRQQRTEPDEDKEDAGGAQSGAPKPRRDFGAGYPRPSIRISR